VRDEGDDCLDQKDEDCKGAGDGEHQRAAIRRKFVSWSGKWLTNGASATLFTTSAQSAVELEAAARTDSQAVTLCEIK